MQSFRASMAEAVCWLSRLCSSLLRTGSTRQVKDCRQKRPFQREAKRTRHRLLAGICSVSSARFLWKRTIATNKRRPALVGSRDRWSRWSRWSFFIVHFHRRRSSRIWPLLVSHTILFLCVFTLCPSDLGMAQ